MEEDIKKNTCNCDANLPVPTSDAGKMHKNKKKIKKIPGTITNMTALPVMKLFFGGLNYEVQTGAFQLGRLKCYGDKAVDIATSCAALKKDGVMTSGC